jgi:hypothetical protein
MNDSTFDPSQFLDATTTEALVKRPPLPAGQDFIGVITDIASRAWTSKKEDAKVKAGIALDLKIAIDLNGYPDAKAAVGGIDSITMTPSIMLDLKDDQRSIDWGVGKNGSLRRYRDALDMNKPGETFSPRQMVGRQIRVKIKHRPYEGEVYDEVDSVAKA